MIFVTTEGWEKIPTISNTFWKEVSQIHQLGSKREQLALKVYITSCNILVQTFRRALCLIATGNDESLPIRRMFLCDHSIKPKKHPTYMQMQMSPDHGIVLPFIYSSTFLKSDILPFGLRSFSVKCVRKYNRSLRHIPLIYYILSIHHITSSYSMIVYGFKGLTVC